MKDILRSEATADDARAEGDGEVATMLNQLLGATIARTLAEATLADKSPRECARLLVRYHTDGEL